MWTHNTALSKTNTVSQSKFVHEGQSGKPFIEDTQDSVDTGFEPGEILVMLGTISKHGA